MRLFTRSFASLGLAVAPLSVVLSVTNAAHAEGCATDADCGHGFTCWSSIGSSTGSAPAGAGAGGAAASPAIPAMGGAPVVYFNVGGHGGLTNVAGSEGSTEYCGDGLCDTSTESPDTCPADCVVDRECAPASCTVTSDCATGYSCLVTTYNDVPSGAGTPGSISGECVLGPQRCSSDSDCAAGMFCDAVTTASGAGGFNDGPPSGSAGFGTGGKTALPANGGSNDVMIPFQGVCDYHSLGVDPPPPGIGGMGASAAGRSSTGSAPCPGGGCGPDGTGGTFATGAAGTTTNTGSTAASGGTTTGGSTGAGGSTASGTTASNSDASGAPGHEVMTDAGCAVSPQRGRGSFGGFALVGLALAWATRRRRVS